MAVFCLDMVFAALSTNVLILSFLGPEKSRSPFWIIIQKMRSLLDLFCCGGFRAFAGLSLFLAVIYGINRLIAGWTGTGEGAFCLCGHDMNHSLYPDLSCPGNTFLQKSVP